MKTKYFFLAAAASVMLTACSNDGEVNDRQIRLTTKNALMTRSTDQSLQLTQFAANSLVDIFLNDDASSDTEVSTYPQPVVYKADGEGNLTTNNGASYYWPVKMHALSIYGVYPSGAATSCDNTAISFSVQADQSAATAYNASDLMTGAPSANPVAQLENPAVVPLTFTHLLTKININLSKTTGTTDITDEDLANAVISIVNTKPTTTFNPKTATVTAATGDVTEITAGTGTTVSAIVVPQTIAANQGLIQVKIGDDTFLYAPDAELTLAPKSVYTYNIRVNKPNIVVTSSITSWSQVGTTDGMATLQVQ